MHKVVHKRTDQFFMDAIKLFVDRQIVETFLFERLSTIDAMPLTTGGPLSRKGIALPF